MSISPPLQSKWANIRFLAVKKMEKSTSWKTANPMNSSAMWKTTTERLQPPSNFPWDAHGLWFLQTRLEILLNVFPEERMPFSGLSTSCRCNCDIFRLAKMPNYILPYASLNLKCGCFVLEVAHGFPAAGFRACCHMAILSHAYLFSTWSQHGFRRIGITGSDSQRMSWKVCCCICRYAACHAVMIFFFPLP